MAWDGFSFAPSANENDPMVAQFVSDLKELKNMLKEADLEYFSLHTVMVDHDKCKVWLNPVDHMRYNYGAFTLDDLLDWINGEGPIIHRSRKK